MKIARTIDDLPVLQEDNVRLVHRTWRSAAEQILVSGLNYERQGAVDLTTLPFSTAADAAMYLRTGMIRADCRYPGDTYVVLDMPNGSHRLHRDVTKAPGVVPKEYVVGIIPTTDSQT